VTAASEERLKNKKKSYETSRERKRRELCGARPKKQQNGSYCSPKQKIIERMGRNLLERSETTST